MIGEVIYHPISELIGDDLAPKITGMIIDMPKADLTSAVGTYASLKEKISEGQELLKTQG